MTGPGGLATARLVTHPNVGPDRDTGQDRDTHLYVPIPLHHPVIIRPIMVA